MTVTYDSSKVTGDDIQKKIAGVGHDTEKFTAKEEVYKNCRDVACMIEKGK